MDAIDAPVNTDLVENCQRIPSKGFPKKVILTPYRRKNSRRILLNKKKLKQLKPVLELDCVCKFTSMRVYVQTTKNSGQNAGNYGMPSEVCPFGSVMDP